MASLLERPRRGWRRARRQVLLRRRPLAAVTAGCAVLAGLHAAAPPPPSTVAVQTVTHDLPSGAVLRPGDLTSTAYPPQAVPSGAVRDPRRVVGATLATPMERGEAITEQRVVGQSLLSGYPGAAAVPLRITDGDVVGLLRVGDVVSFVVGDPDGRAAPEDLVDDVPVVAIPRPGRQGAAAGTPGRLVVVAVPRDRAAEIAARAASGVLIPVWKG
jgi:Flp pilus assembly protein CpaB